MGNFFLGPLLLPLPSSQEVVVEEEKEEEMGEQMEIASRKNMEVAIQPEMSEVGYEDVVGVGWGLDSVRRRRRGGRTTRGMVSVGEKEEEEEQSRSGFGSGEVVSGKFFGASPIFSLPKEPSSRISPFVILNGS